MEKLKLTIPAYEKQSLLESLSNAVALYRHLRTVLFDGKVSLQSDTEKAVMLYFNKMLKH